MSFLINVFEKKLLKYLLILGLILTPLTLVGKDYKKWLIAFLLNSYSNTFAAPILVKKGFLRYPIRYLTKYYKSSIIYDYLLCSLVTVWYCRASDGDNWKKAFSKVWIFVLPQVIVEFWLEKKTNLIKYNKGWYWLYSLVTIATAKLSVRTIVSLMDKYDQKNVEETHKN